jgi:hypothetical protein
MRDGLNSGRDEERIASCRWCGDDFTPAGIGNHQRHCDENPHPGITYEQQVKHEIPPVGGDEGEDPTTDSSTDLPPRQVGGADEPDSSTDLPPREVLSTSSD